MLPVRMPPTNSEGISFTVHVRPGARRTAVEGDHGGALAVRVAVPPAQGRANEAVRAILADAFGVRRSAVHIVTGRSSRRKEVRVLGDPHRLAVRLTELLAG